MYPSISWVDFIAQIKAGEDAGMEQLYLYFSRGIRCYLRRHVLAEEVDDQVHDTFVMVVKAVRRGDLREPDCFVSFVRTVVHRQVSAYIKSAVHRRQNHADVEVATLVRDRAQNPEQEAITNERAAMMKTALATLSTKDREILIRYYLNEESLDQICAAMSLTETQFRLAKSRAKAKFGAISRKILVAPDPWRTNLQSLWRGHGDETRTVLA